MGMMTPTVWDSQLQTADLNGIINSLRHRKWPGRNSVNCPIKHGGSFQVSLIQSHFCMCCPKFEVLPPENHISSRDLDLLDIP